MENQSKIIRVKKAFLWGAVFFGGYVSINMPLIGGGEYQPLLLLILAISIYFNNSKKNTFSINVFLAVYLAVLITVFINLIYGDLNIVDLFKIMVGPLFLVTAIAFVTKIPFAAYKLLICFHLAVFLIGIISPVLASSILELFGFRSGRWYAYFSSEPSYFVINFSGMLSMMFLKGSLENFQIPKRWLLISIILLVSSKSVTSLFFVAILLLVLFLQLRPFHKAITFVFCSMLFICLESEISFQSFDRVILLTEEIFKQSIENILYAVNIIDPSGFWRPLTNIAGILSLINAPFGYGHLQISSHVDILSKAYPILGNLINSNEVFNLYLNEGPGYIFFTNAILPAYSVFGGFLLSIMIIIVFISAMNKLFKYHVVTNNHLIVFSIFYLIVGFIWQTALSNPFWWITLGCALAWQDNKIKSVI